MASPSHLPALCLTALALLVACARAADLYCKDESGNNVDWFIMLKYPVLSDAPSGYTKGYNYYYLDAVNHSSFKEGVATLESKTKGALALTLNQLYTSSASSLGYAMYNDDAPDPYSDSSYRAHAKGVVAANTSGKGFWLVHSTPRFPYDPATNAYEFPSYATDYGQSFLCLSLQGSSLDAVGTLLYYDMPNFYVRHMSSSYESILPNLYAAVVNDSHTSEAATTVQALTLALKRGNISTVLALAKTKAWNKDLWDDLVAPELGVDLAVETWLRGGELGPNCSGDYEVLDVETVKLGSCSWPETKDHSKYGITLRTSLGGSGASKPWVCIGDINRMTSQRSRGGGAVCLNDSTLWKAFDALIQKVEDC